MVFVVDGLPKRIYKEDVEGSYLCNLWTVMTKKYVEGWEII